MIALVSIAATVSACTGALAAMFFKIDPSPTFVADVPLSVPGDDRPKLLKLTFRHKGRRALADYQARAVMVAQQADAPGAEAALVEYVAEIIEGWVGLVDAEGRPLPYTPENLALLLDNYPAAGAEIVRFYNRQLGHARAGN